MTDIKIYDADGNIKDALIINDEIDFSVVDGRVFKGTKCYYKGIGVPYSFHFIQMVLLMPVLMLVFVTETMLRFKQMEVSVINGTIT